MEAKINSNWALKTQLKIRLSVKLTGSICEVPIWKLKFIIFNEVATHYSAVVFLKLFILKIVY